MDVQRLSHRTSIASQQQEILSRFSGPTSRTWTGPARLREKTVVLGAHPHLASPNRLLDLIDIDLLAALAIRILVLRLAPVLVELEVTVALALLAVRVRLVDLGALGQFAVGLQTASLVGAVLEDHVALLILVVAQREEDDVALVDPDFLAEFATDVRETFGAVEAECLQAAVAEHFEDLGIFCEEEGLVACWRLGGGVKTYLDLLP
jgi:hypothetical protein